MRSKIAFLMLVTLAGTSTAAAEPVDTRGTSDRVSCGSGTSDALSEERIAPWLSAHEGLRWHGDRAAHSALVDPLLALDFTQSPTFEHHLGGRGGSRILYDAAHRTLAVCFTEDSAWGIDLVSGVPPPPFAVVSAGLTHVRTSRGLRIGSTLAEVWRVYGYAPVERASDGSRGVLYRRKTAVDGATYQADTWFGIAAGHVVAIGRLTGF